MNVVVENVGGVRSMFRKFQFKSTAALGLYDKAIRRILHRDFHLYISIFIFYPGSIGIRSTSTFMVKLINKIFVIGQQKTFRKFTSDNVLV